MARRTRSFLFDNISKRLVQNTNKTAKEINTRVSANTTANTDILTKAEVQTVVSNTGINTLSDISIANVANEQVLQYNANTAKWENETLSLVSSVDGLTDTNLSSLSNGDYLVYSSSGSEWINRSLDLSGYVTDTEIADYSNTAQMNTAIAASNTALKSYVDTDFSNTYNMGVAIASSNTAMKNYVDAEVAGIVNSAPAALDTLNELAAALGDDANFSTTTSTALGNRLRIDVSNQSLTGTQQTNALTNLGITATVAELNYVDGVTSNIQTQLDAKGTSSFSGAYADLTGKPTIPTNNNQLTNGAGYLTGITSSQVTTALGYTPGTSSFSGAYADLSGKPTIPTNNNQLTNGAGYITGITSSMVTTALGYTPGTSSFSGSYNDLSNKPTIPTNNNQLTNGAGYITSSSLSGYQPRTLQQSSRNLVFATGSTGAGGIFLEKSDGSPLIQLYSDGTNYGFLWGEWGGWDIKKADGGPLYIDISGTLREVYHTGNLPTIPTNNNQLTNGAGYITNGANYNVNNAWLRENGDNANVKLYGNSRQMAFRTDGQSIYDTSVVQAPFVWLYGGNAGNEKMWLSTGGNLTITGNMTTGGNINVPSDNGPTTTGTWIRNTTAHGYIQLGPANSGHAHIYTDRTNFYFNKTLLYANGNVMWHAANDGSGSGLDADTLDGLQLNSSTTNNQANAVVRTQANGYCNFGWINTVSGDRGSTTPTRIYASNDAYIRYYDLASFRSFMNVPARSSTFAGREIQTTDSNYWIGSSGWGAVSFDTIFDYGSTFFDAWSNPSGQPSGTSHWTGFNALHYTNGSTRYGWTMTMGAGNNSLLYVRGRWNTSGSWSKVWNASNDGSGSGLDADTCDGQHLGTTANPTFNQIYANDWFRVNGADGIYWQTYGGGWQMVDTTWVRAYNGKAIYATNTIATTGNICAYYSDERLKSITGNIDNALDKVLLLEGFYYTENELAKELGYKNDKQQVGLSAQKVQAVLPEAVELAPVDYETHETDGTITSKSGENYLTVDYSRLVPLLVEAIKEQQKQIEELKEKLG